MQCRMTTVHGDFSEAPMIATERGLNNGARRWLDWVIKGRVSRLQWIRRIIRIVNGVVAKMNQRAPPRDTGACPIMHTDYRVDRPVLEHRARLSADREAQPFYWNDSTEHGFWMVTRFA